MSVEQVVFFGKHRSTPAELEKLNLLGRLFGYKQIKLHTTLGTTSNAAVSDGYRKAGRVPTLHSSKLDTKADEIVVYCDDDLFTKLAPIVVETTGKKTWTFIRNEKQLDDVLATCLVLAGAEGILPESP